MANRPLQDGDVVWTPTSAQIESTRIHHFTEWVNERHELDLRTYQDLWWWSVDHLAEFWDGVVDYFDILYEGHQHPVIEDESMPGAVWFPRMRLNYAEQVFRHSTTARPAIIAADETGAIQEISWARLERDVAAFAATLRRLGVRPGDRVASVLPNRAEVVVAFLAAASIGAIWSSCAPEMGPRVVVDRFGQIEPTVLLAPEGYAYRGRWHDRTDAVAAMVEALPSIRHVVHVPGRAEEPPASWRSALSWRDAIAAEAPLQIERVPFDHPLWIVYSSGTTGLPKAMVHGHGGTVLGLVKSVALQTDVHPEDRNLMLASTGWIVWNILVGNLLVGATVVLYDGHPNHPDPSTVWRLVSELEVTHFGCGAAYLQESVKSGFVPAEHYGYQNLRAIISAGSPLTLQSYEWVYDKVDSDLQLVSASGGTDVVVSFVSCAPTLPIRAGRIQCADLGVAVFAYDEQGESVVEQVGELVVTRPMPSMPLYFWNDPDGVRYHDSYFDMYPGVWRHGDWIQFFADGTCVIFGRSDTTINRFGIRMGTSDIYSAVERVSEVVDALVVDLEYLGRPSFMPLFVVLPDDVELDDALRTRILTSIRDHASPRHVPDAVVRVPEIPRTLTGKKMELPIRKLLLGAAADTVLNPDTMANPGSIPPFLAYADEVRAQLQPVRS